MSALLLAIQLAFAQNAPAAAAEEGRDAQGGYLMNDVGAWVYMPPGLEPDAGGWSDTGFSAKTGDGGVELKIWLTDFQVPITMDAMQAWGKEYLAKVDDLGGKNAKITSAQLHDWGDKKGGEVDVEFDLKDNIKGYAYHAIIQSNAQMIHIRSLAAGRNAPHAKQILEQVATSLKRVKEPAPEQTGTLTSSAGFTVTMPEGWRAPIEGPETDKVLRRAESVGIDDISDARCATAIVPPPAGELDVFLACKQKYFIGPLDEYSWKAEEKQLYDLFHFEEAKIPTAEQVHVGDRLGFYYKAREGEKPMRLVVAPYEGGLLLLWGIAGSMHAEQLDETMKSAMASVKFTGPNGGQQAITLGDRINYWIKYRPFSPQVLVPAFLLVAGLVALFIAGRRFFHPPVVDI
jgi:hypothetical protein